MTPTWKPAADSLVADLRNVFGDRLLAVVAYGPLIEGTANAPLTCLALVSNADRRRFAGVRAVRAAHGVERGWQRRSSCRPRSFCGRSTPSLSSTGRSSGPTKWCYGDNPFTSAVIAPEDLRRACELQAKSHLVHLREAFIEAGGRPTDVAELVTTSAPAFTQLLRNVARLNSVTTNDRGDVTRAGARAVGIPEELVADMLNLERQPGIPATDPSRLFPEYLAAVEQLARAVDGWRA